MTGVERAVTAADLRINLSCTGQTIVHFHLIHAPCPPLFPQTRSARCPTPSSPPANIRVPYRTPSPDTFGPLPPGSSPASRVFNVPYDEVAAAWGLRKTHAHR